MGIYDREYYRSRGNSFFDHVSRTGGVCKWIVVLNVVAFLTQVVTTGSDPNSSGWFTDLFLLDTNKVFQGQVWRIFTSAFLHDPFSLWHILFNMLFLWWFGRELEDFYGSREFACFYLVGIVAGSVGFLLYPGLNAWLNSDPGSAFGYGPRALGASGAVTAVMVLAACRNPRRSIYIYFLFPIPIWLFVGFQVFRDFLTFTQTVQGRGASSVAVTAHLGGAVFGFLYFRGSWYLSPWLSGFRLPKWQRSPRQRKLKVYAEPKDEHPEPYTAPASAPVNEQFEAKVDAVLQKIKRHGKDSLTPEEQQVLLQASEVYKQRRS